MLGLPTWSEAAEVAYFDVVGCADDELVLKALRVFLFAYARMPEPVQLRETVAHLPELATQKEVGHA